MEKTFLEITHAWIYARGEGGGGLDLPWKFQIYRIHLVKIPENSPFPFWKQSYSSNPRIHPPNLYSLASIFMDFVTIKISMISKVVANDLINSLCYKKLDFVEH